LKFKGLAMTSHRAGLVTIVPVTDALDVDPALVGPDGATMTAGDMVVTRVFSLRHVNTASAMNLLNNLKLSVSASPIAETGTLIVTCYAYRMARIEQLLDLVDRPGRAREFRYRPLRYTMAGSLATKVEALAAELQTVPVRVTAASSGTSPGGATDKPATPSLLSGGAPAPRSSLGTGTSPTPLESTEKDTVYLDVDERTNRLLMIGQADQLAIVEEVIDALDVEQSDLRSLKTYAIVHMTAGQAKRKLEDLDVLGKAGPDPSGPGATSLFSSKTEGGSRDKGERVILQETQVTVLESTNSLLINATAQQHGRIRTVLAQVDVAPEDLRILKTYDIRYVDASEVKKKLEEFGFIGDKARPATSPASVQAPGSTSPAPAGAGDGPADESALLQETQVSVLESTNSLLINATEFAHTQISRVIQRVDAQVRQEAIPYEIYFLENQDPEALAEVLGRLIAETVKDKEAKVEQVVRRLEDEILIVPDKGTFSLVVYGSRENQEWISKLIRTLDRRRPQVLIDVTLVEIRKSDQFNYDLNLVGSLPDMRQTSGQTGSFMVDEDTTVPEKLLEPGSLRQFIDFQANSGAGTGFYADLHINALLTAMQTKNYGRVLAKPKVLAQRAPGQREGDHQDHGHDLRGEEVLDPGHLRDSGPADQPDRDGHRLPVVRGWDHHGDHPAHQRGPAAQVGDHLDPVGLWDDHAGQAP